jgi:NADH:ubiquinone oxidoreductase subunit 5 (subunit L)/multisubunit Na+/H+ antiporter MnhA subunit
MVLRLRGEPIVPSDLNQPRPPPADRIAAGFLLVLLAIGSLALWVVVPAGWLWVASKITNSTASHFAASILGMPVAIILFGIALSWINRLYLRVRWSKVPPPEVEDEDEERRIMRGPLEPLLVGSLVLAIALFFFWFFVLAEDPPPLLPTY